MCADRWPLCCTWMAGQSPSPPLPSPNHLRDDNGYKTRRRLGAYTEHTRRCTSQKNNTRGKRTRPTRLESFPKKATAHARPPGCRLAQAAPHRAARACLQAVAPSPNPNPRKMNPPPLVKPPATRRSALAAARAQWNCSASVDPASAVVEQASSTTFCAIWSK